MMKCADPLAGLFRSRIPQAFGSLAIESIAILSMRGAICIPVSTFGSPCVNCVRSIWRLSPVGKSGPGCMMMLALRPRARLRRKCNEDVYTCIAQCPLAALCIVKTTSRCESNLCGPSYSYDNTRDNGPPARRKDSGMKEITSAKSMWYYRMLPTVLL
jgi:hypothetical protein